jgi:hypothetical protein
MIDFEKIDVYVTLKKHNHISSFPTIIYDFPVRFWLKESEEKTDAYKKKTRNINKSYYDPYRPRAWHIK